MSILETKLTRLKSEIDKKSFEVKDTSYKRWRYFGTIKANTDGCIIVEEIRRTKHLKTYVCMKDTKSNTSLFNRYVSYLKKINAIPEKSELDMIKEATSEVESDIKEGVIYTPYAKHFIASGDDIYYCSLKFGLEDYNRWCAMPRTEKCLKVAKELNTKIYSYLNI